MRRRSRVAPRVPKVKKTKAPTIPKPKPAALRDIYRRIITANITVRLAAFEEAMVWWDSAIPYFLSKKQLTAAQQKQFALANKARTTAITAAGTGASATQAVAGDQERENAYKATITLYQKIWPAPPKLDAVWQKFQSQKGVLEKREQELTLRFQSITDALNQAFGSSMGLTFMVQKSEKARQFDGINKILLSQDLAKALVAKSKTEGMLPVLFSEAHTALYASAIEQTPDGQTITRLEKLARTVPTMLESILRYCNAMPRNKVFRGFADDATLTATPGAPASTPSSAPKAPRAPRAPGATPIGPRGRAAGPKVGGRYVPGSAMGMLFERLSDQKPHKLTELFVGIPSQDPMGRLKWIVKHGTQFGNWKCDVVGQQATLTILKPV
jgi:hypothetical protein